eukprot:372707-Rhodomonas_salina.2
MTGPSSTRCYLHCPLHWHVVCGSDAQGICCVVSGTDMLVCYAVSGTDAHGIYYAVSSTARPFAMRY